MSNNNIAYLLDWDTGRFNKSDVEFDGFVLPFDNYKRTKYLMRIKEYKLPENIYFDTFFDLLSQTDFPMTDLFWPIMSNKMYEILLSCGNFDHKAIPVIMLKTAIKQEDRFDNNGELNPTAGSKDFKAIHLTSYADIFDYEKSIYTPHKIYPEKVGLIKKIVLNSTIETTPPLFRLSECSAKIFISAHAKKALEKAKIQGLIFKSLSEPY